MASHENRRLFLLGITLNELGFILFFLLLLVSAVSLQSKQRELEAALDQQQKLQQYIARLSDESDTDFKRLQLLEDFLMEAGGFQSPASEQQMNELFAKLVEADGKAASPSKAELQQQLQALQQTHHELMQALDKQGLGDDSPQAIENWLAENEAIKQRQQALQGQLAYLQKKYQGSGLDHPPCWADSKTGSVEYLYRITLYDDFIRIDPAWPSHRQGELENLPGAFAVTGKVLSPTQFRQQLNALYQWSKNNKCRHFVRINDANISSKQAFKRNLLIVENYFYKYLEH